jgi:hypothetical protein
MRVNVTRTFAVRIHRFLSPPIDKNATNVSRALETAHDTFGDHIISIRYIEKSECDVEWRKQGVSCGVGLTFVPVAAGKSVGDWS